MAAHIDEAALVVDDPGFDDPRIGDDPARPIVGPFDLLVAVNDLPARHASRHTIWSRPRADGRRTPVSTRNPRAARRDRADFTVGGWQVGRR